MITQNKPRQLFFSLLPSLARILFAGKNKKDQYRIKFLHVASMTACFEDLLSKLGTGTSWKYITEQMPSLEIGQNSIEFALWAHKSLCKFDVIESERQDLILDILKSFEHQDLSLLRRCLTFFSLLDHLFQKGGSQVKAVRCFLRQEQRFQLLLRKLHSSTAQIRFQAFALQVLFLVGVIFSLLLSPFRREFFVYTGPGQLCLLICLLLLFLSRHFVSLVLGNCEDKSSGEGLKQLPLLRQSKALWESVTILISLEGSALSLTDKTSLAALPLQNSELVGLYSRSEFASGVDRSVKASCERLISLLDARCKTGASIGIELEMVQNDLWYLFEEHAENIVAKAAPKLVFPIAACLIPSIFVLCLAPSVWEVMAAILG